MLAPRFESDEGEGNKSMTEKKIILADEPLKSPDQDKLGFAPFTKRIATIIKNMQVKESIVFAIYGEWGFWENASTLLCRN